MAAKIPLMLSACLIVKNSEKFLRRCLESICEHVDQIVVVDTGSTDSSIDIAKSFGAEVYSFKWCDDFSAARNKSLEYAAGEWVLQVDSDHVLEVKKGFDLRRALGGARQIGFFIKEVSILKNGGKQLLDRMLLFRRVPGLKYEGVLHEHPMASLISYAKNKGIEEPFSTLDSVRVLHYGYFDIEQKLRRNIRILERGIAKEPMNWHYRYKLLLSYESAGEKGKFDNLLKETFSLMERNGHRGISLAMVGIAGIVGKWMLEVGYPEGDAIEFLERYYRATRGKDLRIALPLAEFYYIKGDYKRTFDILSLILKEGYGPGFIPLTEVEKSRAFRLFSKAVEKLFSEDDRKRILKAIGML
ncbi:MAG: glycosyltransferase family 2 protein [Candidatus Marinimicrobia bacterium]|nr:glycosyltransferase family 2 protein [Candidatus Neomarinimicrobiota bacterium]